MAKCNFICDQKESEVFPVTVFVRLANSEQRYVQILTRNVERMNRNSLTPPQDKMWLLLRRILQNVLPLKTFLWGSVPNVIHVVPKLRKVRTKFI